LTEVLSYGDTKFVWAAVDPKGTADVVIDTTTTIPKEFLALVAAETNVGFNLI
jgi:hypothetical protein